MDELLTAAAARRRKRKPKKKINCRRKPKRRLTRKEAARRRRVCRRRRPAPRPPAPSLHPAPVTPPAPPSTELPPDPPAPPPATAPLGTPIAAYTGEFGIRQAERLLWRAGMGPRPGDLERFAAMGLEQAVATLTRPSGPATLVGPEPRDGDGGALYPYQAWGHDVCWWMDRMVRSDQPLIERLTLILHDWFATSNDAVGSSYFLLEQSNLFRGACLGSFRDLVRAVTADRAMLIFLDGIDNRRGRPNENYARELMELFTLGADRGAYTEDDVREMARALTGWRADWVDGVGFTNFRFDVTRFDPGNKTVFGQTGAFDWEDACRLVLDHPLHASFVVTKLWKHFVTEPIPADALAALESLYVSSGHQIRPLVEAILLSPWFYEGGRQVKPPAVHVAGMHRALDRGLETDAWGWLMEDTGQRPTTPPDVAGWDETRWLDSSKLLGRWRAANEVLRTASLRSPGWDGYPAETPQQAVANARAFWGDPWISDGTVAALTEFATACMPASPRPHERAQRQNVLRQMIAISPDYLTC